jgi:glycine oxidase
VRVLVIGAGIAGSLLSRELHHRGASVVVVDDSSSASASRAAAGLVNPVIGIRLTLVPGVEKLLAASRSTFSEIGQALGRSVWHPMPIDRVFRDSGERGRWAKRKDDAAYAPWVTALPEGELSAPEGGIRILGGGWFDYRCLPDLLACEGISTIETRIHPEEVVASGAGVVWRGEFFDAAVFCRGYSGDEGGPGLGLSALPWKAARGEILTVRSLVGPRDSIWMRGIFVVPLGKDLFRVGSTYRWSGFDEGPSLEAREEIMQGWRALGLPEPEVVDQRVGVRPILQDRQPVAGLLPGKPACWICNGLGSRGAMIAPTLVRQLAEAILGGPSVEAAWNVERFFDGA